MRPAGAMPVACGLVDTDGGRAWWIVVGAMLAHAIPFGLIVYTFTVFFPPILEEFGAGQGAVAWIVSLATALMLAAGGIAGNLTDRFGPRAVIVMGAGLIALGVALASGSSSVWQLILTYGLIGGVGSSMTFIPAIAAIGKAFERRKGLALGLAAGGTGIGTIALAPVASALIESVGWRPALRILAVVAFVGLLAAAAMMPRAAGRSEHGTLGPVRTHRSFRLMVVGSFVGAFGYWVPFFFMAPYAEDQGITPGSAALIVAVMGVANTLGRIVMGGIADKVGRLRIMQWSNAAMAVALVLWPLATTTPQLITFGLIYALAAGTFIALLPALASDYFGGARLGAVTGWLFAAAALGTLVSAPVAGTIFDATDGYAVGTTLAGLTLAIGAVPLFMLPDPRAQVVAAPGSAG